LVRWQAAEYLSHETSEQPMKTDLFDLSGRRICVVGAAGGIGSCLCRDLAARGVDLICADVDEARVDELGRALRREGARVEAVALDASGPNEVRALVARVEPLHGMVSTVGVNIRRRLLDLTDDDFDKVVRANLASTFILLREFGRSMASTGGGSIVVFSSIRATVTEPGQGAYAATKAGVVMLAKTLAAELGRDRVRVNAISPSLVETAFTRQLLQTPAWAEAYREKTALGRWASPHDLLGAVIFLLSDASVFVTGTQMPIDGGWTAIDGRFEPPL
jgi:NAD(P)-dependent dehydrogenase (short-subunit alcohol dehydrogenase family)